jgi:hypothetical protein
MARPVCEVCGTYEGRLHHDDCPFHNPKLVWKRIESRWAGGSAYVVRDADGEVVLHVHRKLYCGFWYVYVGVDQDEPDGTRFDTLWEAKLYAAEQVERDRVSLGKG